MPSKNIIKIYVDDGYYHLYNRGVEQRDIFLDEMDYAVFLSYLKEYLTPIPIDQKPIPRIHNYTGIIDLLCHCLMPNHFHLLVHQYEIHAISAFMQSLTTKYTMYFNAKYDRVGSLFQGTYKAVLVSCEEQLLYLTKYIHCNPKDIISVLSQYPYSSLRNYYGLIHQNWLKPDEILAYFSRANSKLSYSAFMGNNLESDMAIPLYIDN